MNKKQKLIITLNRIPHAKYGKVIRAYRLFIEMKQTTLANEVGLSQQMISSYEKDLRLKEPVFVFLVVAMGSSIEGIADFYTRNSGLIN